MTFERFYVNSVQVSRMVDIRIYFRAGWNRMGVANGFKHEKLRRRGSVAVITMFIIGHRHDKQIKIQVTINCDKAVKIEFNLEIAIEKMTSGCASDLR